MPKDTRDGRDRQRIDAIQKRVTHLMSGGRWFTLDQIRCELDLPVSCDVPRRVRQVRDAGFVVDRRRVPGKSGVFEYRATPIGDQRSLF